MIFDGRVRFHSPDGMPSCTTAMINFSEFWIKARKWLVPCAKGQAVPLVHAPMAKNLHRRVCLCAANRFASLAVLVVLVAKEETEGC